MINISRPDSAALPTFGDQTCRILIVSDTDRLDSRLAEDLRDYDLDALSFVSLSDAQAFLEHEHEATDAVLNQGAITTILICTIDSIAQASCAARQALSAAQIRAGMLVLGGVNPGGAASSAARPVVVNDVLPMPFDYQEMLQRLRWHLEHKLIEKRATLAEALLACISEALMMTDSNDRIVWVNARFTELTGYQPAEVVGKRPKFMRSSQNAPDFLDQMWRTLKQSGSWRGEIWNRRKDGGVYAEWLTVSALRGPSGIVEGYLTLFTDITARKIREEHLQRQALHDHLTGLPNRVLLEDRYELAVAHSQRNQTHVALLFIDLDGFKDANDRFGHAVGDQLLVELGARLRAAMRANDTVARFGGDEFVCLLSEVRSEDDVKRISEKLLAICSTPFAIEGKCVEVSASVGIGFHPDDGEDFETLLSHADASMYRAKAAGKNGHYRIGGTDQSPTDQYLGNE